MGSRIKVQRICQHCGEEFTAQTTVTKFCSHKCSQRAYKARKRKEKIEASNNETIKTKLQPIALLKAKEFLTVKEVAQLLNCSIRTIYYYIENGTINAVNLGQRMTRVKRSDIDYLFKESIISPEIEIRSTVTYKIEDCYTLTEVQKKYGISEKALYEVVKRNNIPKIKKGWYAYVPKTLIDNILT